MHPDVRIDIESRRLAKSFLRHQPCFVHSQPASPAPPHPSIPMCPDSPESHQARIRHEAGSLLGSQSWTWLATPSKLPLPVPDREKASQVHNTTHCSGPEARDPRTRLRPTVRPSQKIADISSSYPVRIVPAALLRAPPHPICTQSPCMIQSSCHNGATGQFFLAATSCIPSLMQGATCIFYTAGSRYSASQFES